MQGKLYCFLNMYGYVLFCAIAFVVFSIFLVKGTRIISWELAFGSGREFVKKYESVINRIVCIVCLCFSLAILLLSIPSMKDIKAVVTNQFQVVTGIVIYQDNASKDEIMHRTVTVVNNETGKEEDFHIFRCPLLDTDEEITIRYYKNSHKGFLE